MGNITGVACDGLLGISLLSSVRILNINIALVKVGNEISSKKSNHRIMKSILGNAVEQLFGAAGSGVLATAEPAEKASGTSFDDENPIKIVTVHTQGISSDWLVANGDFKTITHGNMDKVQLLTAMRHLKRLDTPDISDPCPAQILTGGHPNPLSFIGQGEFLFCPATGQALNPDQATNLAFRNEVDITSASISIVKRNHVPPQIEHEPVTKSSIFSLHRIISLIASAFCFIGTATMLVGANSMRSRGVSMEDINLALSIGAGFAGGGLILLYFSFRRRRN